jgi:hypothetical protein
VHFSLAALILGFARLGPNIFNALSCVMSARRLSKFDEEMGEQDNFEHGATL